MKTLKRKRIKDIDISYLRLNNKRPELSYLDDARFDIQFVVASDNFLSCLRNLYTVASKADPRYGYDHHNSYIKHSLLTKLCQVLHYFKDTGAL